MRTFPDVLGTTLDQAVSLMNENGCRFEARRTAPERGGPAEGIDRVVKQELLDQTWLLTICRVPDAYEG